MVRIKKTIKYGQIPRFDTTATTEDRITRKTGIAYPVGAKNGYYFNKATGKELIKNNIRQFIRTLRGERIMLPSFGLSLQEHLFENISLIGISLITDKIREGFTQFFPTLELREVKINDIVHGAELGGINTPEDFPQRSSALSEINSTLSNSLTITLSVYYKDVDEMFELEATL